MIRPLRTPFTVNRFFKNPEETLIMFKPFKTLIVCAGLLAGLLSAGNVLAA